MSPHHTETQPQIEALIDTAAEQLPTLMPILSAEDHLRAEAELSNIFYDLVKTIIDSQSDVFLQKEKANLLNTAHSLYLVGPQALLNISHLSEDEILHSSSYTPRPLGKAKVTYLHASASIPRDSHATGQKDIQEHILFSIDAISQLKKDQITPQVLHQLLQLAFELTSFVPATHRTKTLEFLRVITFISSGSFTVLPFALLGVDKITDSLDWGNYPKELYGQLFAIAFALLLVSLFSGAVNNLTQEGSTQGYIAEHTTRRKDQT